MKLNLKVIPQALNKAGLVLKENAPAIMTGMAVVGTVATVATAGVCTVKACRLLHEAYPAALDESYKYDKQDVKEVAMLVWPYVIPPVVTAAVTIVAVVASYKMQLSRVAAATALYTGAMTALEEYKDKVEPLLTKKEKEQVADSLADERMINHPASKAEVHYTGLGETLCYDMLSGRYFTHDIERIRRAENEFNHDLISDMTNMTLNDWYLKLGIPTIGLGDDVGWSTDRMLELDFRPRLTDDGRPCLCLNYERMPDTSYHYHSF